MPSSSRRNSSPMAVVPSHANHIFAIELFDRSVYSPQDVAVVGVYDPDKALAMLAKQPFGRLVGLFLVEVRLFERKAGHRRATFDAVGPRK